MRSLLGLLALAAVLAAAPALAAGKTYRWVDARGKVHFGDQPPANATEINPTVPSAGTSATEPPAGALGPEECARRQKLLDSYRAATTVTETDGLGNKREYSEAERQKLIARTEQGIRDGCPN